uniref:Uncharacterized protein n=1 Tax=Anguilla anguilla TaxID=7936 RepID=A0A0E9RDL9_ANGAN
MDKRGRVRRVCLFFDPSQCGSRTGGIPQWLCLPFYISPLAK